MGSRLPFVVAAQSGPTSEQIEHRVTRLLFDPDKPNSLAQAAHSLENVAFRKRISFQASAFVQRFGWTGPSKQLFQMYGKVLKQKKDSI
ncbi:MAG: glycosyl transferase [Bacilli bacterium]|nr:glycosyl transferase [Bacilli bacterium]